MDGVSDVGTYLKVFDRAVRGFFVVEPEQESSIDAAVSNWIEKRRDTLLHLDLTDGDTIVLLASRVGAWMRSTPAGRARSFEIDKACDDENEALKQSLGIWDDGA